MVHAFYAAMGGFVLEIEPISKPYIPCLEDRDSPLRLTLTSRGVLLLAKCGLIPHISADLIADKSKTDSLGTALVCAQAAWTLLEVFARLTSKLPLTLLEITMMGHVLWALAIYFFWSSKPLSLST